MVEWFCFCETIVVIYFLQFGRPLSIKCYAVPDTREGVIVFCTNSSGFSAPDNGKRPVFASNQDLHTSLQAEPRFQFTRVPSCKSSPALRREEVLHETPSVGWVKNLALWCNPLETGNEKDCFGRREEERGHPQAQHGLRLSVSNMLGCKNPSLTERFHQTANESVRSYVDLFISCYKW